MAANQHLMYAQIYTRDGQPFAGYWRDRAGDTRPVPAIPAGQTQSYWYRDGHLGLARAIIFQGKPTGTVYIRSDLGAMNDRLKSYAVIIIVVFLASLVVALLISRISQRVISKPVMQLAQTVRVVSQEKNYSIRAVMNPGRDEVSTLIESFNEMLEQIQQRDGALQQAHDQLEQRSRSAPLSWLPRMRSSNRLTMQSSAGIWKGRSPHGTPAPRGSSAIHPPKHWANRCGCCVRRSG